MHLDPRGLCQIEIPVEDLVAAIAFYRDAFGWTPAPADLHDFIVLDVPGDCAFGISLVPKTPARNTSPQSNDTLRAPTVRQSPVLYFACDDPAEIVRKVLAQGGRLEFGPTKLMGYGEVTRIEDPEGIRWGLYRRASMAQRQTSQAASPS